MMLRARCTSFSDNRISKSQKSRVAKLPYAEAANTGPLYGTAWMFSASKDRIMRNNSAVNNRFFCAFLRTKLTRYSEVGEEREQPESIKVSQTSGVRPCHSAYLRTFSQSSTWLAR